MSDSSFYLEVTVRTLRERVRELEAALDEIVGLNDRDPGVSRVKMRRIVERVKAE